MDRFVFDTMNNYCNDACSCAPAFSYAENMYTMDTIFMMVSIFVISIIIRLSIGAIILSVLFIMLCLVLFIQVNMDGRKQVTGLKACYSY